MHDGQGFKASMYVCMYLFIYVTFLILLSTDDFPSAASRPLVSLCMYVCMYVCIEHVYEKVEPINNEWSTYFAGFGHH